MTKPRITATQAFNILVATTMRPFTKEDWYAFSGCESDAPMIGEFEDEILGRYTVVVDGAELLLVHEEDEHGGILFNLSLT